MDPKKTNNVEPGLLWSEMKLNGNINNSTLQGGTGKEEGHAQMLKIHLTSRGKRKRK